MIISAFDALCHKIEYGYLSEKMEYKLYGTARNYKIYNSVYRVSSL